jgi:methionyl-tRNA formyltransferase
LHVLYDIFIKIKIYKLIGLFMKIVFMGTPDYATEIFKSLIDEDSFDVVALFTQPDKPVGRKQIITPPHIKQYCIDNSIEVPIYQPNTLKNQDSVDTIKSLNPDFIIVAAYGQILSREILDIAPCINLHASILPKYRGASPIQDAIKNQDSYTGVTSMLMDVGLDTGDILGYSYVDVADKRVDELFNELSIKAAKLTVDTIKNYNNIRPMPQNSSLSCYSKKIKKDDGLIAFDDASKIDAKFRAYCFWPGVFLDSKLKIKDMTILEKSGNYNQGEILEINKNSIVVGCQTGKIKIVSIQPPSKKEMCVVDYLRGRRLEVGDTLL